MVGLADEAEVDGFLDGTALGLGCGYQLARGDQPAILAGNADGTAAGLGNGGDQRLVDAACQNHLDHRNGGLIGHPQTVDEL